jgi:hypothetical protein
LIEPLAIKNGASALLRGEFEIVGKGPKRSVPDLVSGRLYVLEQQH